MPTLSPTVLRLGLGAVLCVAGCDNPPPRRTETTKTPAAEAPTAVAAPSTIMDAKPAPPSFRIDASELVVGTSHFPADAAASAVQLGDELARQKQFVEGQSVVLHVDRRAKPARASVYLKSLYRLNPTRVLVHTDTRKEYPGELPFSQQASAAPGCSVVTMIRDDRTTAVWTLAGGTAQKHRKGMAGPDLTTTADSLGNLGKKCKTSSTLFVAADSSVDWGLTYDLAASAHKLEKATFDKWVLLADIPVPGRKVELK